LKQKFVIKIIRKINIDKIILKSKFLLTFYNVLITIDNLIYVILFINDKVNDKTNIINKMILEYFH